MSYRIKKENAEGIKRVYLVSKFLYDKFEEALDYTGYDIKYCNLDINLPHFLYRSDVVAMQGKGNRKYFIDKKFKIYSTKDLKQRFSSLLANTLENTQREVIFITKIREIFNERPISFAPLAA